MRRFILIALAVISAMCFAGEFKNWQHYDFSGGTCGSIVQDGTNNLWFGGTDVVTKFDGTDWQTLPLEGEGAVSVFVFDGDVCIVTSQGFYKYDGQELVKVLAETEVRHAHQGHFGEIWYVAKEEGQDIVCNFDPGEGESFFDTEIGGEYEAETLIFYIDQEYNQWTSCSDGTMMNNGFGWEEMAVGDNGLADKYVTNFAEDSAGRLYLMSPNSVKISIFKESTFQNEDFSATVNKKIFIDSHDRLWYNEQAAGSADAQLYLVGDLSKLGEKINFTEGFNGELKNVTALFTDVDDNLWFATKDQGIFTCGSALAIEESPNQPRCAQLQQNYPNPFNPVTSISYSLDNAAAVKLAVYNSKGELVRILADGSKGKGSHSAEFCGSNMTSGIYYYTLSVDGRIMGQKKMVLCQ